MFVRSPHLATELRYYYRAVIVVIIVAEELHVLCVDINKYSIYIHNCVNGVSLSLLSFYTLSFLPTP